MTPPVRGRLRAARQLPSAVRTRGRRSPSTSSRHLVPSAAGASSPRAALRALVCDGKAFRTAPRQGAVTPERGVAPVSRCLTVAVLRRPADLDAPGEPYL